MRRDRMDGKYCRNYRKWVACSRGRVPLFHGPIRTFLTIMIGNISRQNKNVWIITYRLANQTQRIFSAENPVLDIEWTADQFQLVQQQIPPQRWFSTVIRCRPKKRTMLVWYLRWLGAGADRTRWRNPNYDQPTKRLRQTRDFAHDTNYIYDLSNWRLHRWFAIYIFNYLQKCPIFSTHNNLVTWQNTGLV